MLPKLSLTAVTASDRNVATSSGLDCIHQCGGWVEDVHFFSNIMTTINFVIPQKRIFELEICLSSAKLSMDLNDDDLSKLVSDENMERKGSLQITFIHKEPDLKRVIPAIPG